MLPGLITAMTLNEKFVSEAEKTFADTQAWIFSELRDETTSSRQNRMQLHSVEKHQRGARNVKLFGNVGPRQEVSSTHPGELEQTFV